MLVANDLDGVDQVHHIVVWVVIHRLAKLGESRRQFRFVHPLDERRGFCRVTNEGIENDLAVTPNEHLGWVILWGVIAPPDRCQERALMPQTQFLNPVLKYALNGNLLKRVLARKTRWG
jgi:hypothetical protein